MIKLNKNWLGYVNIVAMFLYYSWTIYLIEKKLRNLLLLFVANKDHMDFSDSQTDILKRSRLFTSRKLRPTSEATT